MSSNNQEKKDEDDTVSQANEPIALTLRSEARQALDSYLLKLSGYLHTALLELRDNLTSEVEEQVLSNLAGNDLNQMQKALAQLGTPEEYAAKLVARLTAPKT